MSTPSIKIDQIGQPAGITGQSRDDLVLSQVVTVTDTANVGAGVHLWTLLARPVGSAVVLAGAATVTATFTPDVDGSYLLKKEFNAESSGTLNGIGDFVSTQGGAAVLLTNGIRVPAPGETVQFDSSEGWHPAMDFMLREVDANLPTSGEKSSFPSIPTTDEKTDLGTIHGSAEGTIWYADALGAVAQLAPGTAGQVLITNGAAAAPSYSPQLVLDGNSAVFSTAVQTTPEALGYAANISIDAKASNIYTVTLSGVTAQLDNATNAEAGQSFSIIVTQDGVGGRAMTFGSNYTFGAEGTPDFTTSTLGVVDIISCLVISPTKIACTVLRGF